MTHARNLPTRAAATLLTLLPLTHPTHSQSVKSCPANLPLSCHNSTAIADQCCFNAPGGQLLQTQFWDYDPATGPADSWTLHGLWPDNCDGSYQQYCDSGREYPDIRGILEGAGENDLLAYMDKYWKDYQGDDNTFWKHEWDKHGTCISSFDPPCFTDYTPKSEVPPYFQKAVTLFQSRDSYSALKSAGIVPAAGKKYAKTDVANALAAAHAGKAVTLDCDDAGAINQIWYQFNVRGSAIDGDYEPADPVGSSGSCPAMVSYPPKGSGGGGGGGGGGGTTTTTTKAPAPTTPPSPGTSFQGKGYLDVVGADGTRNGCLISDGSWYTTGTCATYTATTSGSDGFTLKSSKGPCKAAGGQAFKCASAGEGTVFEDEGEGRLGLQGTQGWSAAKVPSGTGREGITPGAGAVGVSVVWRGV